MNEYRVAIFQEVGFFTVLLGQGKMDPIKFSNFLNLHAKEGWQVVTVEKENRRKLLLFKVEAMVVVMQRRLAA